MSMDLFNAVSGSLRLDGVIWSMRCKVFDAKGLPCLCFDAATEFFRVRNNPQG